MTLLYFLEALLLLVGSAFLLLAGIGSLVFPDFFTRMAAVSKASTLGAALMLAGTALHFRESSLVFQCAMVILFLFVANPIASHLLGRTAYLNKVPLFRNTADEGQDLCRSGQDDSKNLS